MNLPLDICCNTCYIVFMLKTKITRKQPKREPRLGMTRVNEQTLKGFKILAVTRGVTVPEAIDQVWEDYKKFAIREGR